MRALPSFMLGLFLVIGPSDACAGNGVLLPSCDSGNCSSPNLGMGTRPKTPAQQPEAEPPKSTASKIMDKITGFLPNLGLGPSKPKQETPQAAAPSPMAQSPASTTSKPSPPAGGNLPNTAAPQQQSDLMRAMNAPRQTYADPRLRAIKAKQERLRNRPPLILNDIDPATFATPEIIDKYPNGLSIAVAPKYTWGAGDVGNIKHVLGYEPKQIPQNCQLRLKGKVGTNEGMYAANVYAGQRAVLKYAGTIKDIAFSADAVCNTPPGELPASGKVIRQTGNKLVVTLKSPVMCALPQKSITAIEIHYGGDGAANCKYQ